MSRLAGEFLASVPAAGPPGLSPGESRQTANGIPIPVMHPIPVKHQANSGKPGLRAQTHTICRRSGALASAIVERKSFCPRLPDFHLPRESALAGSKEAFTGKSPDGDCHHLGRPSPHLPLWPARSEPGRILLAAKCHERLARGFVPSGIETLRPVLFSDDALPNVWVFGALSLPR